MYGRMYVCVYVCMYLCMHLSLCQKLRLLRTGGYGILQTRPYAHTHVLANTHTSVSDSARTYALTDALSPAAHPPLSTLPDLYHTHPHTPAPVGASSPYTLAHTHTGCSERRYHPPGFRLLALHTHTHTHTHTHRLQRKALSSASSPSVQASRTHTSSPLERPETT